MLARGMARSKRKSTPESWVLLFCTPIYRFLPARGVRSTEATQWSEVRRFAAEAKYALVYVYVANIQRYYCRHALSREGVGTCGLVSECAGEAPRRPHLTAAARGERSRREASIHIYMGYCDVDRTGFLCFRRCRSNIYNQWKW